MAAADAGARRAAVSAAAVAAPRGGRARRAGRGTCGVPRRAACGRLRGLGGGAGRGVAAAKPRPRWSHLTPLVSLAGFEPSVAASVAVGAGPCSWQPAVTFRSGNGEWTLGPDADPLQPAFVPELPHCHLGTGLRWKDDGALPAAVQ